MSRRRARPMPATHAALAMNAASHPRPCWLLAPAQWGQNSGHVGVPLEAIPNFIQRLTMCYEKATGVKTASKSPKSAPGSAPKGAIDKKKKKEPKKKEPKEKKEEAPKKTVEDLDAELMSYTAARAAEGEGAEEAAPAMAAE